MEEKDKRQKVTISLYEKDIAALERSAKLAGVNKSEYVRALIHFTFPKPLPDKLFWERMNELYTIHDEIKDSATGNEKILSACKEMEQWILKFQEEYAVAWEVA